MLDSDVSKDENGDALALAHSRFAKIALWTYVGGALVALTMLFAALISDYVNDQKQERHLVLLQTEIGAHHLGRQLRLMANELSRLGLRAEVDLLDQNMKPERALLQLIQDSSAIFRDGIAIIGVDGTVAWAEPQAFLQVGSSFAKESWFINLKRRRRVQVVSVEPERADDSLLYIVAPIVRSKKLTGALLGAIDLAKDDAFYAKPGIGQLGDLLVATKSGAVVFPPKPPENLNKDHWFKLLDRDNWAPFLEEVDLFGKDAIVGGAQVAGTDLLLMAAVAVDELYKPIISRFWQRAALGLVLAVVPFGLLVLAMRSSLKTFKKSQQQAAKEEHLKQLGKAVHLIAHEVKNSLNGMRLGLDMVITERVSGEQKAKAAMALRHEIGRLSDFTTDLLSLSRGIKPRPGNIDFSQFVSRIVESMNDLASQARIDVEIEVPQNPVVAQADPALMQSVLSNLMVNAFEALESVDIPDPKIVVKLWDSNNQMHIRVVDNGPGIPLAIKENLFEPFVSGKLSGSGIGLALSKQIVVAHGGDLILEPTDKGASFLVNLPMEGHQ